jgi:hypothetical protein
VATSGDEAWAHIGLILSSQSYPIWRDQICFALSDKGLVYACKTQIVLFSNYHVLMY